MSSNLDLGLVTAYGYAVDAGFTGTEAEFAQMLANIVVYKNAAETAANNAALSAGLAEQYKDEAFDTTPAGYEDFVSETNSSLANAQEMGAKNLFNINAPYTVYDSNASIDVLSDSSVKLTTVNASSSYRRQALISIPNAKYLAGKQVTISCSAPTKSSSGYSDWRIFFDADAGLSSQTELAILTANSLSQTITIPSNFTTLDLMFRISQNMNDVNGDYIIFNDVQIELGTEKTPFNQYAQSNAALTKNKANLASSISNTDRTVVANRQAVMKSFIAKGSGIYINRYFDGYYYTYIVTPYNNGIYIIVEFPHVLSEGGVVYWRYNVATDTFTSMWQLTS